MGCTGSPVEYHRGHLAQLQELPLKYPFSCGHPAFDQLCNVEPTGGMLPASSLYSMMTFFFFFPPHHVAFRILVPNQGSNQCPLHWEHRVLTGGPPGKSHN